MPVFSNGMGVLINAKLRTCQFARDAKATALLMVSSGTISLFTQGPNGTTDSVSQQIRRRATSSYNGNCFKKFIASGKVTTKTRNLRKISQSHRS